MFGWLECFIIFFRSKENKIVWTCYNNGVDRTPRRATENRGVRENRISVKKLQEWCKAVTASWDQTWREYIHADMQSEGCIRFWEGEYFNKISLNHKNTSHNTEWKNKSIVFLTFNRLVCFNINQCLDGSNSVINCKIYIYQKQQ